MKYICASPFILFIKKQWGSGGITMDIYKCPECMAFRMFEDGKCTNCGYCSIIRASINALYSQKRNTKCQEYETIKRGREQRFSLSRSLKR
jgi:hypothetical protein